VLSKLNKDKASVNVTIKSKDLKHISTTKWSIQNIGFINWVIMVRGSLYRTDYLAKRYEYEMAKCKKNLSDKELSNLEKAANEASDRYRKFISTTVLVD
jgi:hypothetical protein